jgi:hypothetical protein
MNNHKSFVFKDNPELYEPFASFVTGCTQSSLEIPIFKKSLRAEANNIKELKYYNIIDTIEAYDKLDSNWDSYEAEPISKKAISIAIDTIKTLQKRNFLSEHGIIINIFPMRDGGIQYEFDNDFICSELEISPSGELTFIKYDATGKIIIKNILFDMNDIIFYLETSVYA